MFEYGNSYLNKSFCIVMAKGVCLVSQEIRDLVDKGKIITGPGFNDFRIQPSSFEPTIMDYLYVLDIGEGMIRPQSDEKIRRKLLELTRRQRPKKDIGDGYEAKVGFSYVLPLEEKPILSVGEHVKSSPKSSTGRMFAHTRLFGDHNPCFDELSSQYAVDTELNLYLLFQPLAFNVILHPGLSLNQLRFFRGVDSRLSDSEIISEFGKNPFLFDRGEDGELTPVDPFVKDGMQLHLGLDGIFSEGIVGLRARHNPTAIDLGMKGHYDAEDYLEPMFAKDGKLPVKKGTPFLFASKEYFKNSTNLNFELESNHHASIRGEWHKAGFIDNGFEGVLVFEVIPEEDTVLQDGMPASRLKIFRTGTPDKVYGEEIGSNYTVQTVVKPAKFFRGFDFKSAARTHEKLSRDVLVQDAEILNSHRKTKEGFEWLTESNALKLFADIEKGFFHSRYDCESDEEVLQVIPYVMLFNNNGNVFYYVRASNIKDYGDERLFGKHSIGFGGHVSKTDGPDYVKNCLEREVIEEEVRILGLHTKPKLVGTLMCYDKPVDKVHFGLIYTIHVDGDVKINDPEAVSGEFVSIEELVDDALVDRKFESWSKYLIPILPGLYGSTS